MNFFQNSNAYKNYEADSSNAAQNDFNVSNLTNALNALGNADTTNFSSILNVDSFAKNSYEISQLSDYGAFYNSSANLSNIMSNASNMNELLSSTSSINTGLAKAAIESYLSNSDNTAEVYNNSLSTSGSDSLLNMLI
jgi:hypothetical protein